MTFHDLIPYIYNSFLVLVCGYAVIRGNRSEYAGATIMFLGSMATILVARTFEATWTGTEYGIFLVDLAVLFALIHLTIVSDRFWPMWATAFHLIAVSVHVATMVAPEIKPWAFATGAAFWAYPMLLALAVGSHEAIRTDRETKRLRSG